MAFNNQESESDLEIRRQVLDGAEVIGPFGNRQADELDITRARLPLNGWALRDTIRLRSDASDGRLTFIGLEVVGELDLSNLQMGLSLTFIDCGFDNLDLEDAQLQSLAVSESSFGGSFNGDGLATRSGFALTHCRIAGNFRMLSASLGSQANFSNLSIEGSDNTASFALDGSVVRGNLQIQAISASDDIRFMDVQVFGNFAFREYTNTSQTPRDLRLDRFRSTGSVEIEGSKGLVRLIASMAAIGLQFRIMDADLESQSDAPALTLDGMRAADIFISRTSIIGEARLVGCAVIGQLAFLENEISWGLQAGEQPKTDPLVSFDMSVIDGEFILADNEINGYVSLRGVRTNAFHSDWRANSPLMTRALQFQSAELNPAFTDRYIEVLEGDPDGFNPVLYARLANIMESLGHPAAARRIRIASESARRRISGFFGRYVVGPLSWLVTGYGFRFWMAGVWLAVSVAAGSIVFSSLVHGSWWEVLLRSETPAGFTPLESSNGVPFVPALAALESVVPLYAFDQFGRWNASETGTILTVIALRSSGAVLLALLVEGFARRLRGNALSSTSG